MASSGSVEFSPTMMKFVPPEVAPCRKLLVAVADPHLRGRLRLRIMLSMGSACAWRCIIGPVQLISSRHGAWNASLDDGFGLRSSR